MYTGETSIDKLSKSVVMFGKVKAPTKRISPKQKYDHLRSWMLKFSRRYCFSENEIKPMEKGGLAMLPTEHEFNLEMGSSFRDLQNIMPNFDDDALLFYFPDNDVPELGIKKQTDYVILRSLYPEVYSIVRQNMRQDR